jgi:hypothetical protein
LGKLQGEALLVSQKKSMVLVDFYNLELNLSKISEPNWRTPEADRPKIMSFFAKHAPEVLKFRTEAEIEVIPKPADAGLGTLGYFEFRRKQSWFDSDGFNFYADYKRIHELIDLYLEGKEIPENLDAWIRSLPSDVRIGAHRVDGKGGKVYAEHLVAIISTSSDPLKVQVALGKMRYQLWRDILSWLNGETEIRKCSAKDCEKIFIPTLRGKEQLFCSERCRNRIAQKRFREKRKITVFS